MYVRNASVSFGGLLLRNDAGCGVEILAPSRARASICRIKSWWGALGGLHVAGASLRDFVPRPAPIREHVL